MEYLMGVLKVRIIRGSNLAIRDFLSSDPYVIISLGNQTVKTSVIRRNINPYWNEELTLGIPAECPPLILKVMDRDRLSKDDSLGHAEVDIQYLIAGAKAYGGRNPLIPDEELAIVHSSAENGFIYDSHILLTQEGVKQTVCMKLKDIECGELELELHWICI